MEYRKILTSRWLSLICLNFRYEATDTMDKRVVYALDGLQQRSMVGIHAGTGR